VSVEVYVLSSSVSLIECVCLINYFSYITTTRTRKIIVKFSTIISFVLELINGFSAAIYIVSVEVY